MLPKRVGVLAVALALFAAPDASRAQERDTAGCECVRFERLVPEMLNAAHVFTRRARLGVMLQTRPDPAVDSIGVRIEEVVEDGPAARAGLRAGDIITHVNGRGVALRASEDARRPRGATSRVTDMLREVEPGDTVRVGYRRGGDARSAMVVTSADAGADAIFRRMPDIVRSIPRGRIEIDGRGIESAIRFRRHGLRLEDMNEGLRTYFGVGEGALVLEIDSDAGLPLRAGDVILRIGDRAVPDASAAHRILGSYSADEDVRLEVMRERQRVTVTGRVGSRR